MKWFTAVTSMEKLRSQYKALALKNHPDVGGSVKAMQEINAEYDTLFARLKAERKKDKETHTHNENEEDKAFRSVLNEIIGFDMEIEIIGKWIWAFNSYAYKDRLKELRFKFAPKKKAWCWHFGDFKRYHKVNNQSKTKGILFS